MAFVLRDARAGDHAAVLALNDGAVPAVNRIPLDTLRWLAASAEAFRVALDGDRVVGFLLALPPGLDYASLNYRWFQARYDDFAYVDRVVVAPEHARRGVGRLLYADLVARSRGHRRRVACEVNVRPRNDPSLAFHTALGFSERGQQDTEGGAKRVSLMTRSL